MATHDVDVLIIGGGIAGLSAAYRLMQDAPDLRIALLEAGETPGGKMQQATFTDGHTVDVGPDALWIQSPAVAEMLDELGMVDPAVRPVNTATGILHHGKVCPLPGGMVGGIPTDPAAARRSGLLSARGALRASHEEKHLRPHGSQDVSIFHAMEERLGTEVAEGIVDPLLGGISAGNTRTMSLAATAPHLFTLYSEGKPFLATLQHAKGKMDGLATFAPDGLSTLVNAILQALEGRMEIVNSANAEDIAPAAQGYRVRSSTGVWEAQRIVLAVPSFVSSRLLAQTAPKEAAVLGKIPYASVTTVTLALASSDWKLHEVPGFVIPRSEGELITAVTCLSERWTHHRRSNTVYVRCSCGRIDDDRPDSLSDDELLQRVHADVERLLQVHAPLREGIVQRWPHALPQYEVGHRERLAACTDLRERGIECIGAAFGGLGVASCIDQGTAAAGRLRTSLQPLAGVQS